MKQVFTALLIIAGTCSMVAGQDKPTTPSTFASRTPRYHLVPTDVIDIHYVYTPEFNQSASVQPDGFISLQLVGNVAVGGLTLDEAKEAIRKAAAQRLQNPEVSVLLKEYQKPYITVAGEVTTPGRLDLTGRVTAIEAVAMAGGLKADRAKHSQVILFRRVGPDLAETKILDLKAMMTKAHINEDVTLASGDLLIVPQNQVSKIERFVHWTSVGMFLNPLP